MPYLRFANSPLIKSLKYAMKSTYINTRAQLDALVRMTYNVACIVATDTEFPMYPKFASQPEKRLLGIKLAIDKFGNVKVATLNQTLAYLVACSEFHSTLQIEPDGAVDISSIADSFMMLVDLAKQHMNDGQDEKDDNASRRREKELLRHYTSILPENTNSHFVLACYVLSSLNPVCDLGNRTAHPSEFAREAMLSMETSTQQVIEDNDDKKALIDCSTRMKKLGQVAINKAIEVMYCRSEQDNNLLRYRLDFVALNNNFGFPEAKIGNIEQPFQKLHGTSYWSSSTSRQGSPVKQPLQGPSSLSKKPKTEASSGISRKGKEKDMRPS